jgi:hypothetical protein
MKPLIVLLLALAAGTAFAAQTYKWVDEKGVTTYGEKPPPGRAATAVDTTPSGGVDGLVPRQERSDAPRQARPEPAPQPVAAPAPVVRGMSFETFVRLQRGMTEGELLGRAGKPDYAVVENFDITKTYYYLPTVADPFTTVVTLRGGRIQDLDRIKKF